MSGAPHEPQRRFPFAATLSLYAAGFAALAWPWLSGRVTIPWDAKSQFFPQLAFLARSLAEGQSPFWTPHVYAGWPQIADPQALIFSPLHVLLAFFDAAPGFQAADAVTFAHLFLGGLGILLIFRQRGWHAAGALVAALAFAFGGSNASRLQHIGQIESVCWLPLALWALMRALERADAARAWRTGALAGLFAGLVALGRDQVALLSLYLLTGFVLWHWLDGAGRRARLVASLRPLAAGAVAGLFVIAVPVTLTALLASESNRPEVGYAIAARGSLHPSNLLTLAFADLFGASDPKVDFWGAPSFPWHEVRGQTDLFHAQNIGQLYAGALVAIAVLGFGLVRGWLWAREVRFFSVALAVLLLYALGRYTPFFYLLYEAMPGVALYRRPADASFLVHAMLVVAAGYCIHRWLTDVALANRPWQSGVQIGIFVGLIAIAFGLAGLIGRVSEAVTPAFTAILFAAAGIGVLWLARRVEPRHALAASGILGAFCVADLAWNNAPDESSGLPPQTYDALLPDTKNEIVGLLKWRLASNAAPERRDRVEMIGLGYHWPNLGQIHRIDHLFAHNPLRLRDFARATNAQDTVAVPEQRMFSPLLPSYRAPLEHLFGVRFVASGVPVEQIDKALKPGELEFIARGKSAHVYENPRALPRVMMLGDWRVANFEEVFASGVWPDADPARTVLLEREPAGLKPGAPPGRASIVRYRNTGIEIVVDSPSGGVLVLNDVWHPWWRATLDSEPVEILKANLLFRGVAVPPGQHVVRFAFHPFAGALAQLWDRLTGSR